MAGQEHLKRLLRNAPNDVWALIDLLRDGLDWPFPDHGPSTLQSDEVLIDWKPEELHLDPGKVAQVADIFQVPKFTQNQECGVFVLNFTGGRLPVGAVRRVVERLISNRRGRTGSGRLPQWSDVNDLIFFCLGNGPQKVVHIVNFREEDGKRALKVLSWSDQATQTQIDLIAQRDIGSLKWAGSKGPAIVGATLDAPGFGAYRATIRGAKALATHMAAIAQDLRDELLEMHEVELDDGPIRTLFREFQRELIGDLTPEKFADVFAQTMVYGLLSARIAHPETFDATAALEIDFDNPLLNALYGKFSEDTTSGVDLAALGLQELAADLASPHLDIEKMLADFGAGNRREDPVVHFYEEFLNQYDHAQRIDAGAFYTPTPVVHFMVEAVDHLLRERFGLALGIADPATWGDVAERNGFEVPRAISPRQRFVSMVDPATGTGTYLVEWIRQAKKSFLATRPRAEWPDHLKRVVMPSMHAFELMLAPYAVAHLKVALECNESAAVDPEVSILLTDSLEQPGQQLAFGVTDDPVAAEGERAAELKLHERFTVIIGNPPYDREQRDAGDDGGHRKGGVVRYGGDGIDPLLEDVLTVMRDEGLGRHAKNLYNDYVYFWRWAMWRTTQRPGGPGIAAFITPSSYLDGISLAGLRSVMRTWFDEFYIVDLGGDSLGTHVEDNVFDIRIPVTVGIGVRTGGARPQGHACDVRYVRVSGTREQKLDWLSAHEFGDVDFTQVPGSGTDVMTPLSEAGYWTWPDLQQLLPWSHSGSQLKRTWPVAPDRFSVESRWRKLVTSPAQERGLLFRESRDRTVTTRAKGLLNVKPLKPIEQCGGTDQLEGIERYAYRSFERSWVAADARVGDYPRPQLWATRSDKQIFFGTLTSTKLGAGPALVATPYVPDLHFFRNRGARDIFPMWRDREGTSPNMSIAIKRALQEVLGPLEASDIIAYIYALTGTPAFTDGFSDLLAERAGPVRLPITKDRSSFDEVADFGRELLHWHTFGERFGTTPLTLSAREISPITGRPGSFFFDAVALELVVGNGRIGPVSREVYDFEVSSFKVLQNWLGNRSARGRGRTSSPLDAIRYREWEFTDELLLLISILQQTIDVTPRAQALLDRVTAGEVFLASELPQPTDAERSAPR